MINDLRKFWRNKKVFVTGHTGFKGTWLIIFLNLLKAKTYGYSLKAPKNSIFNQTKSFNLVKKNYYSNINNIKSLKKKIQTTRPHIVFHLAAQPLVTKSYEDPIKTFTTNIIGTLNLLEVVRKIKSVKSVVIITTDKVYKIKRKNLPFTENDELGGNDPYSASKASTEIAVKSYIKSFFSENKKGIRVSTARSGNVLGGGDYSKNRILPDIINSINKQKKLVIRNPKHIRPWQHVIEPVFGYLILAEFLFKKKKYNESSSWNFGPENRNFISVNKLVNKVSKIKKIKKILIKKNNYFETQTLKLNSKKAKKFLKWQQKWDIDQTISKIIEWNESFLNKKNMREVTENQIKEYLKK